MDRERLIQELDVLPEELDFWIRDFADCGLMPSADGTFGFMAVQQAHFLKRLLREEGFTLWGAKRRLKRVVDLGMPPAVEVVSSERKRYIAEAESRLQELVRQLEDILQSRQV